MPWQLIANITATPAIHFSSYTLKREDLFNGILDYFPGNDLNAALTTEFAGNHRLGTSLEIGIGRMQVGDSQIIVDIPNWYYENITRSEEDFFADDKQYFWVQGELRFRTQKSITYGMEIGWQHIRSQDTEGSRDRFTIRFSVYQLPL